MIQELYLSIFGNHVEVVSEKGEKRENVVVHVDKDGAEEIKKLTKTLSSN